MRWSARAVPWRLKLPGGLGCVAAACAGVSEPPPKRTLITNVDRLWARLKNRGYRSVESGLDDGEVIRKPFRRFRFRFAL